MSGKLRIAMLALSLTACLHALDSTPAAAATFVVINNHGSGAGSLRQAVLDANDFPGADLITFNLTFPDTIFNALASPLLDEDGSLVILESLTIQGPGSGQLMLTDHYDWFSSIGTNVGLPDDPGTTVASESGRVFVVGVFEADNSAINFTLSGVTVMRSGGIQVYEGGSLVLSDTVFRQIYGVWPSYSGSIISGSTHIEIGNSLFSACSLRADGSGHSIITGDNVILHGLRFTYNSADHLLFASRADQTADLVNVEISDCRFEDSALPVWIEGAHANIVNSVFFEHSANEIPGLVGIDCDSLTINNVTMYLSRIHEDNSFYHGSHLLVANSTLAIANTVIYAPVNTGSKPRVFLNNVTMAANVNNFVDDGSLPGAATGDPGLGFRGIDDPAWAPKLGSPLHDAGDNAYAVYKDGSAITHDILGNPRIQVNSVDIGAVESDASLPAFSGTLAATVTDDGILVHWYINHTEDVQAFNIYRQASGTRILIAADLAADQREYRDLKVDYGQSYSYTLGVVLKSGGLA